MMHSHLPIVSLVSFALLLTARLSAAQTVAESGSKLTATLKFEISAEPNIALVVLDVLLPKTLLGRQKIGSITYSTKPSEVFEKDGQQYAQFHLSQFPAELQITIPAEISRYDLTVARGQRNPKLKAKEALQPWLIYEQYLEKHNAQIQKAAQTLSGKDDEATARACFDFVTTTLQKRVYDSKERGGALALDEGKGDCSEFADLFITLCRAKGIPARICEGYLLEPVIDTPKHGWAEIYLERYGWVPFDPFYAHLNRRTTFTDMRPIYLYLDFERRNGVLNQNHYWAFRYEGTGKVTVRDSFRYAK
jgi:transglutaminase-like putative cysteine protease